MNIFLDGKAIMEQLNSSSVDSLGWKCFIDDKSNSHSFDKKMYLKHAYCNTTSLQ